VRVFERKQHVELLPQPVPLSSLKLGDAVVAFSRRDVLTLRDATQVRHVTSEFTASERQEVHV
jgi:hypothetical protein